MIKHSIKYIITGLLLVIAQGALDNYVNLSVYIDIALPMFIILMLPYRTGTVPAMLTAFVLGLIVDVLSNGIPGMTSAALTAAALCRRGVLALATARDTTVKEGRGSMESIGTLRFTLYSIPLILVYLCVYIAVDISGLKPVGQWLPRLVLSLLINTALAAALYAVITDNRRK